MPAAPEDRTPPEPGEAARFDALVAEADAVSVAGWDFSWLDGRATEERPSWGYARLMGERMGRARAALDIQTGGGEVLASVPKLPVPTVATESWPPNIARATALLHPRGVVVVADDDEPPLPFGDAAFDLVVSRHPVTTWWQEIARVLAPGGTYLSQQVGPASVFELVEYFLGPQPPEARGARDPQRARADAEAAGLDVVDLRAERLRTEFSDIGAVVYFLRKVIWMVPGFTVEQYRPRLGPVRRIFAGPRRLARTLAARPHHPSTSSTRAIRAHADSTHQTPRADPRRSAGQALAELHHELETGGPFVAHTTRFLIEARKPA